MREARKGKRRKKEKKKKKTHGTVRVLISKVTSHHSGTWPPGSPRAPGNKSFPTCRHNPTFQKRQSFQRLVVLKDSFWDLVQYRAKGRRLWEEYLQLHFDNLRIIFMKSVFKFFLVTVLN